MWHPAVLMAAVAFDKAVAEAAERVGIPSSQPTHVLIRQLGRFSPAQMRRLEALRKIRNGIVHSETKGEINSAEQAVELVKAFKIGASMLNIVDDDTSD